MSIWENRGLTQFSWSQLGYAAPLEVNVPVERRLLQALLPFFFSAGQQSTRHIVKWAGHSEESDLCAHLEPTATLI